MSALSSLSAVEVKSLKAIIKAHGMSVTLEAITDIMIASAVPATPATPATRKGKGKGQEPKTAKGITAEHVRDWTWVNFNLPEGVKPTDTQCEYLKSQKGRFSAKRGAWYITSQVDIATLVAALTAAA